MIYEIVLTRMLRLRNYTVSQKRPTFTTYYNFYIHGSIATIFGINVAEKVGNQSVLYFLTTPNYTVSQKTSHLYKLL